MKLSFIVPVYNLEDYIEECIMSLLNQDLSHSEYEILCINDSSTDSSLEILKRLAKEHTNIIIINQENQGVSAARNNGIKNAKGEYIWFVDGDDLIARNCLKFLITFLDEKKLPLIRFKYKTIYTNNIKYDSNKLNKTEFFLVDSINLYSPSVWTQIFRKSIINCSFNTDLRIGEDGLFSAYYQFQYFPYYLINQEIYFYRQRITSAVHDKSLKTLEKNINNILITYQEIKKMRNIYCTPTTLEAYNKLIANLKASYLFESVKLPSKNFNIYYRTAIEKGIYPLKCDLLFLIQKPNKNDNLITKAHILSANIIKVLIALGLNLSLINKIVYLNYKKHFNE